MGARVCIDHARTYVDHIIAYLCYNSIFGTTGICRAGGLQSINNAIVRGDLMVIPPIRARIIHSLLIRSLARSLARSSLSLRTDCMGQLFGTGGIFFRLIL